jgi:hypothetical protein
MVYITISMGQDSRTCWIHGILARVSLLLYGTTLESFVFIVIIYIRLFVGWSNGHDYIVVPWVIWTVCIFASGVGNDGIAQLFFWIGVIALSWIGCSYRTRIRNKFNIAVCNLFSYHTYLPMY